MKRLAVGLALLALAASAALFIAPGASSTTKRLSTLSPSQFPFGHQCATPGADFLCTDVQDYLSKDTVKGGSPNGKVPWTGPYLGHDEPSALFYSHVPGSGNDATFNLTLPKQPPAQPAQDGSGTSWGFSSIRRSGSGWRCATTPRIRTTRARVRLTRTRTSTTIRLRRRLTSSASIRGRRSWRCSSIRPAGRRVDRPVAAPLSGAPR